MKKEYNKRKNKERNNSLIKINMMFYHKMDQLHRFQVKNKLIQEINKLLLRLKLLNIIMKNYYPDKLTNHNSQQEILINH